MSKIAITTTSFGKDDPSPIDVLKEKGFEVILNPYGRKVTPDEVVDISRDAVGLIAGTETITKKVLSELKSLRVISRCGVGIDNIDMRAAKRLGIKIFNTPDGPTAAVAELTVGLMLNLLRKINYADSVIKKGKWEKPMGNLLCGKKVGIIGFGRIGRRVCELLKGFGCELSYADKVSAKAAKGVKKLELKKLLGWADIISLHASAKDCLLGREEIGQIKKGAWFVNTARGNLVDEDGLYDALKDGQLAGAAIDVFLDEPYKGRLKELDNVVLTSHIGSYAKEARVEMETQSVKNLLQGLNE